MKKLLLILLSVIMSVTAIAFIGCGQTPPADDGGDTDVRISFAKSDIWTYYCVSSVNANAVGKVEIPATFNDLPVAAIKNGAFENCTGITEVEIPSSVVEIGANAFDGCTGITKVNYLGTVDEWAQIDFLADVYIDGAIETTPDYWRITAFSVSVGSQASIELAKNLYINGEKVTTVNLTTATKVSAKAFKGNANITAVSIPSSVVEIGANAFSGCTALTSAEFAVTSGWGANESAVTIESAAAAANLLKGTLSGYKWTRS